MDEEAESEILARFWADLDQQIEQNRAWLDQMLTESERDLVKFCQQLESDTSLADLLAKLDADTNIAAQLASLDGCQEMTENVSPGAPIHLQTRE